MLVIYLFASGTRFICDSEINALRTLITASLVHTVTIGLTHSTHDDFISVNY